MSELSFESALDQLQAIVKKMESGELTLDQALGSFEEGVKLTRACQQQLVEAEKKIEILTKAAVSNGGSQTEPFNP